MSDQTPLAETPSDRAAAASEEPLTATQAAPAAESDTAEPATASRATRVDGEGQPAAEEPRPGAPESTAVPGEPATAKPADQPAVASAESAAPPEASDTAAPADPVGVLTVEGAEETGRPEAAAEPAAPADETSVAPVETAAPADETSIAAAEPAASADETSVAPAETAATADETSIAATEPAASADETSVAPAETAATADETSSAPAEPEASVDETSVGAAETAAPADGAEPVGEADAPQAAGAQSGGSENEPATTEEATGTQAEAGAAPPKKKKRKKRRSKAPAPPRPPKPESPAVAALRQAMEEKTAVEGKVIGWNNGGFHVVVGEVTAFCPRSEMDLGPADEPSSYVDQTYTFQILKIQKRGRRVVLSRTAVLKSERNRRRSEIRKRLEPGAVLEGSVASTTDFGAFIELGGGVQGLVHVSELSRQRVGKPSELLAPGQTVQVKVLKVEQGGKRISLSMRALEPDPWRDIKKRYPQGATVKGKVEKATNFGAFIELEPGLTGLLPASAMSIPRETSPARIYTPGKEVSVQVMSIDSRRQRISLALEGSTVEGNRVDYKDYLKSQRTSGKGGFNALASALSKLRPPAES